MARSHLTPAPDFRNRLVASVEAAQNSLKRANPNDAAHRCRVALKRARALTRLARIATPDAARAFNAQAKAVMATMSASRDFAAMAEAARLAATGARPGAKAALLLAAEQLTQRAAAAAPKALKAAKTEIARLLLRAKAFPALSDKDLAAGAEDLHRRAERAYQRAHGRSAAERRHQWRKRHKDVQLAAKMLGPAWAGLVRPQRAAALGQILGAERDLLLLEARIATEPSLAGGRTAMGKALHSVRLARRVMGAQADQLGARVYR